jgi:hypothetical protein
MTVRLPDHQTNSMKLSLSGDDVQSLSYSGISQNFVEPE